MNINELILPLGTSIIIGALIGLEREKTKQDSKGLSAIGIRTDILICLFGALSAFLGKVFNPVLFLICLGAMLILTISSYIYLSIAEKRVGVTTEISTIIVYLLGAMTMMEYSQLAVIIAIIVTLVLSLKDDLHKAVYRINYRELRDTIKFAIIAFIILPFLPNKDFDEILIKNIFPDFSIPLNFNQVQILNPYRIWLLVVLVSAISFLGYILVKTMGKHKGISISGLIGGLYSSTATSLSLARKSKLYLKTERPFITGIVLACGISFIRTFLELRALNEVLFLRTLLPLGLMFIYLMAIGAYLYFSKKQEKIAYSSNFKTPFELTEAIKLGGFIIGALILSKFLLSYSNINIYYAAAAAMAFFAVDDPILISTATNAGKMLTYEQAKNVVILVTTLNMMQKVALIYFFGNRKLLKPMVLIFSGLLLVSLLGFIYL